MNTTRTIKKLLALLTALLLTVGAAYAECPKIAVEEYPRVDGSTATLPLSYKLMQAAAGVDEDTARDAIRHNKTTESFYALVDGRADLLLVYEPSEDAWEYAEEMGVELEVQAIGYDAPVFLINDQNPVESLTHDQIVGIYTGEITNWSQVGGDDLPIVPFQRNEESGSQVMMEKLVMDGVSMMEPPKSYMLDSMAGLMDAVRGYENSAGAIGYSVFYYASDMNMANGLKILQVEGVTPSAETIRSGEYTLRNPYYVVMAADTHENSMTAVLYDWILSEDGQKLVSRMGYASVLEVE